MDTEKPDAATTSRSRAATLPSSQADRAYALAAKHAKQSSDERKRLSKREFWRRIGPDGRAVFSELNEAFGPLTFEGAWEEPK